MGRGRILESRKIGGGRDELKQHGKERDTTRMDIWNQKGQDMTEPGETRWESLGQNRLQQEGRMEMNWTRWDRTERERTVGGSTRGGRTH